MTSKPTETEFALNIESFMAGYKAAWEARDPARFRPRWPVIWAVPESHAHAMAPFGRLLSLR